MVSSFLVDVLITVSRLLVVCTRGQVYYLTFQGFCPLAAPLACFLGERRRRSEVVAMACGLFSPPPSSFSSFPPSPHPRNSGGEKGKERVPLSPSPRSSAARRTKPPLQCPLNGRRRRRRPLAPSSCVLERGKGGFSDGRCCHHHDFEGGRGGYCEIFS